MSKYWNSLFDRLNLNWNKKVVTKNDDSRNLHTCPFFNFFVDEKNADFSLLVFKQLKNKSTQNSHLFKLCYSKKTCVSILFQNCHEFTEVLIQSIQTIILERMHKTKLLKSLWSQVLQAEFFSRCFEKAPIFDLFRLKIAKK